MSFTDGGKGRHWRGAARAVLKRAGGLLPALLFVLAVALASFAYGAAMVRHQVFPYWAMHGAVKTLSAALDAGNPAPDVGEFKKFADAPPSSVAAGRVEFGAGESLGGPVLWHGGRWQFMELCPEWGCAAVEYSEKGEVVHAYPLRMDELRRAAEASSAAAEHPHEFAPGFSLEREFSVRGAARYGNGDLLVTFQYRDNAFPYGAGIARIDRGGHPVWYRSDYSHHWSYLDASGVALVPGHRIRDGDITISAGPREYTLDCGTDKPYEGTINFVGEDGRLLKEINALDAFVESPHASALRGSASEYAQDYCDPLHLNYAHRLGADAGGAWGIAPGDIAASLRNLSAFAIIDAETGKLKRLVRGTFYQQHSVRHLEGSTFIMFDNFGTDGVHGPSRLLMIDISDGSETTVFPNDRTPEDLAKHLYSATRGSIDVSPDRSRATVSYTLSGIAVEVRLSDGEVLNVFRNLHDVSGLEQFPEGRSDRAARFRLHGIDYIR